MTENNKYGKVQSIFLSNAVYGAFMRLECLNWKEDLGTKSKGES